MDTRPALVGDIGGTKCLLALAEHDGAGLRIGSEARYASRDHASFTEVVARFLSEAGVAGAALRGACFGIAGPVVGRRVKVTNLPWVVDADELAGRFGLADVVLANDFAAAAAGIPQIPSEELVSLQSAPCDPQGVRLVLGAGTGLGVAALVPQPSGFRVVSGEGGHMGFAPANPRQWRLWQFLHASGERVTVERVVSGVGIVSAYRFLLAEAGAEDERGLLAQADPAAALASEALLDPNGTASAALDLFVEAYGAAAGDLALALLPRGGVFIAGGIAPKILPRLQAGGFMAAFRDKGAHGRLMDDMPVAVVTAARLPLLGAAALLPCAKSGAQTL